MRIKASIEHQTSPHRSSPWFAQGLELVRYLHAAISVQTASLLLLSNGCVTAMRTDMERLPLYKQHLLGAKPCTVLLKPTLKHVAAEVETQLPALQASIVSCCSTYCLISMTTGITLTAI